MGRRYTNTKAIRTQRFGSTKKQKFILVILGIIAVGIIISATSAIISYVQAAKDSTQTAANTFGEIEELLEPSKFMEQYMHVNCNEEVLEKTQTIRLSGTTSDEETSLDFTITKKLPNLMRLKMVRGPVELTFGVYDEQVWRRVRIPNRDDEIDILEGEEADTWLVQSRFYDPIISTQLGYGHIESIETTEYESNTYLKVSVVSAENKKVEVLVDPTTMHPHAEITHLDDQVEMTIFSDFRKLRGMPTPFHLETLLDGVSIRETVISEAAINIGVLSDYFMLPELRTVN